jgi:hypothetical protein
MENSKIEIFSPRFDGERFREHRLPLDLLEDLTALQEMTIEMAKFIYLEKHPDRQRVPKNFTQGISFELESLEPGSTIPKIIMIVGMIGMFPHQKVTFFEEAKVRIVSAVQAASTDDDISKHAPESVLYHFNKFGKKLRSDEFIEFNPNGINKAKFTKDTRRKLILASSKSKEYTEDINLRGSIFEMDQDKNTFQIQLVNGKKIEAVYTEHTEEVLKDAFLKYNDNQKVSINGIGKFNKNSKLIKINQIDDIVLLDKTDVGYRLEEISQLKDGWFDGQGTSIDRNFLNWLTGKLESQLNTDIINTYIFPTVDGNVQIEWSSAQHEVSLIINAINKKGTFHKLDLSTDEDLIDELDLQNDLKWNDLNSELEKIFNA